MTPPYGNTVNFEWLSIFGLSIFYPTIDEFWLVENLLVFLLEFWGDHRGAILFIWIAPLCTVTLQLYIYSHIRGIWPWAAKNYLIWNNDYGLYWWRLYFSSAWTIVSIWFFHLWHHEVSLTMTSLCFRNGSDHVRIIYDQSSAISWLKRYWSILEWKPIFWNSSLIAKNSLW